MLTAITIGLLVGISLFFLLLFGIAFAHVIGLIRGYFRRRRERAEALEAAAAEARRKAVNLGF